MTNPIRSTSLTTLVAWAVTFGLAILIALLYNSNGSVPPELAYGFTAVLGIAGGTTIPKGLGVSSSSEVATEIHSLVNDMLDKVLAGMPPTVATGGPVQSPTQVGTPASSTPAGTPVLPPTGA